MTKLFFLSFKKFLTFWAVGLLLSSAFAKPEPQFGGYSEFDSYGRLPGGGVYEETDRIQGQFGGGFIEDDVINVRYPDGSSFQEEIIQEQFPDGYFERDVYINDNQGFY